MSSLNNINIPSKQSFLGMFILFLLFISTVIKRRDSSCFFSQRFKDKINNVSETIMVTADNLKQLLWHRVYVWKLTILLKNHQHKVCFGWWYPEWEVGVLVDQQHQHYSNQHKPAWTNMEFMLDYAGFFSRVQIMWGLLFLKTFVVALPVRLSLQQVMLSHLGLCC